MTSIKASNPSHPSHPHDLNLSSTYSHHLNTSLENLDQLYDQLEELLIHSTHLSHHLKTLKPSSSLLHPSSRLSRLSWISISNFSSHSLKLKSSTSTSSTPNLLHHPSSHSSQSQNESSSYFDIEGQSLFLPILIHKSVQEIYQRGLRTSGLFRIAGDPDRVEALSNPIPLSTSSPLDLTHDSIHTISSLIKRFLRSLPHPLLSTDSRQILWSASIDDPTASQTHRITIAQVIIRMLPIPAYGMIIYLLTFLNRLTHYPENKLAFPSLAHILGPALFAERHPKMPRLGPTTSSAQSSPRSMTTTTSFDPTQALQQSAQILIWLVTHWTQIGLGPSSGVPEPVGSSTAHQHQGFTSAPRPLSTSSSPVQSLDPGPSTSTPASSDEGSGGGGSDPSSPRMITRAACSHLASPSPPQILISSHSHPHPHEKLSKLTSVKPRDRRSVQLSTITSPPPRPISSLSLDSHSGKDGGDPMSSGSRTSTLNSPMDHDFWKSKKESQHQIQSMMNEFWKSKEQSQHQSLEIDIIKPTEDSMMTSKDLCSDQPIQTLESHLFWKSKQEAQETLLKLSMMKNKKALKVLHSDHQPIMNHHQVRKKKCPRKPVVEVCLSSQPVQVHKRSPLGLLF